MKLQIDDYSEGTFAEIAGDEIVPMLASEIGTEVAAALVGCKIFQGDSDQPATVLDCYAGATVVLVRVPDGRERSFALRGAAVLPTPPMAAAVEKYQGQRAEKEECGRRAIRDFGFEPIIATEDLDILLAAIRSADEGEPPMVDSRTHYMAVMSKYRSPNAFAAVAEAWLKGSDRELLPDVVVQLSSALRADKRHKEAITLTDFIKGPCHGLSQAQKQILLTSRAGAWLDEFMESGEGEALDEARQCVKLAEVMGQSEHLEMVKLRLDRQEHCHPRRAG